MTNNINVQIIEPPLNNLIIETQVGSEPINVSVVSYSGTNISIIHDLPVLPGDINDTIASLLVAGSGISLNYNSQVPSLIISSSGGATLSTEQVQDIVGSFISGVSYISVNYDDNNNILYISATGLQPSGNYALANHNHTSNHITDFNSSVSGLLPVKNISSGSGINVTNNSGNFVIAVTGTFGLTSEEVDDRVSNLLVGGSNIVLNYNDSANQLTISTSGLQPSGNYSVVGHSHSASEITNFSSEVNSLVSGIYAPLNSPNFSGIPTVPTASSGTNSTQAASTAFVRNEISNLVNSAPSTLDTLNELASALGNDPNFATTIASGLANKAPLVHTHSSSDITDFAISVSGLLPVKNISAGSYINVSQSGTNFIVSATGLQPSGNYSVEGHVHDRLTNGDKEVVLSSSGSLTFPSGSILSETNNTISLMPPTAASGQSLVIRPTVATWGLTSSGYIVYGSPITISVTLNSWAYFGTVNYTISGSGVTPQSLGRALTGKLTFVSTSAPDTETITWTIPANSNISEFTLTLTSVDGTLSTDPQTQNDPELYYNFEYNGMPTGQFITVTNNGVSSSEHSHVHLVPGDPTTVDIYLGDDDQYVKIEKDGGDVIVGTDSNNNHWIFDTSGNLRTPTNSIISKGYPGLTQDGSSWFVSPSGSLGGLASTDGQQYIQIGDNSEIYIGLGWPNNAVEWIFNRNGSLTLPSGLIFADNTIQTTAWSGAVSINDITDFASGVSGLLPTVSGSGYAVTSFNNNVYTVSVTGLQPSGNYSLDGHNHIVADVSGLQTALDNKQPSGIYASGIHSHVSNDITDFAISVSGLLPVKNILAGYDINITNNNGVYTVASTNLVHVDSQQPQGFINRTDSRISVSGNIFTIEPTGSSYSYYNKGIKVVKTSGDSLTIPNLTQINYIHFDTINNQISNKTTGFDFSTDIPIAYVAWNSGVGPSGQMTFFAEERHGIVMDTSTHKWIHTTFGAQYVGGLSIGNYVLGGDGSSNSHATISIGNGTLYQEDIEINITDSSSTDPFCQELSPIAQIPVYYHQGTTGQWVKNTATDYPVKYGANGPQYNLFSGGTWTIPDVSPGGATRYFAVWILATNQIDDPIISIMGQRIDSNQGSAESNNSWGDINLTNLPLSEVKPLYRLIFAGDSDYTNVPKCTLLSILDIRVSVISTIAGVTQNDHGSLFGLGDDDHSQYLHVDNNRTVNAIHNFINGLTVNGTSVSVSGHSHTSSDITNFNSSVSGLLPVTNILGGTNISVVPSGSSFTVSVSGSLGLTTEEVDDRVSSLLVAGTGIALSYNDNANTLTVSTTKNIILSDVVSDTNYIGIAPANTLVSASSWKIKRTIYSTSGTISSTGVANNVAWNDRLTVSYS